MTRLSPTLMIRISILLCLLTYLYSTYGAPIPDDLPLINIPSNVPLVQLPLAISRSSVKLTLTPARVVFGDVEFVTPVYHNNLDNKVHLSGPTILLEPDAESMDVIVVNNLTYPSGTEVNEDMIHNANDMSLYLGLNTNFHTHGFHDSSGVFKQNASAPYVFGDNVFVSIPAKTDPSQEPSSLIYKVDTEGSHMPGLHWYHPHKHGGTFIQTLGANGLLYVPDPSMSWLPSENGCDEITSVLKNSTQIFMTITTLPFLPPLPSMDDVKNLENADLALMSNESNPASPLCCSEPGSNDPAYTATGMTDNIILINGIYQPQIKLTTGGYQNWKILNAGPKGWVNMIIVNREKNPAPCEILLYAKDGVFLQEIPRTVNLMILSPGNRAEMLIKCTEPGTYFLSATGDNNFLGNGPPVFALLNGQVTQDVVAEIIVTNAATEPLASAPAFADSIPEEVCVPLRASYAPDLRDENILRHNATDKVIQTDMGITPPLAPQNWSCSFNNRFFEYPTENPWVMRLGSIVEASTMTGLVEHPMHIHINPMMIAYLNDTAMQATNYTFDPWMKVGDYHDTLLMPMYPGFGAGWKLRWQPGSITGYSVAHCHLLHHEDGGCMTVVKWECPGYEGGNTEQPINCPFTFPIPGTHNSSVVPPGPPSRQIKVGLKYVCSVMALFLVIWSNNL